MAELTSTIGQGIAVFCWPYWILTLSLCLSVCLSVCLSLVLSFNFTPVWTQISFSLFSLRIVSSANRHIWPDIRTCVCVCVWLPLHRSWNWFKSSTGLESFGRYIYIYRIALDSLGLVVTVGVDCGMVADLGRLGRFRVTPLCGSW